MYIPKIDDCLKLLTDEEFNDFVAINFSDFFESRSEELNLRKGVKSLYIFLTTSDEIENHFQSQIIQIILYIVIMLRFWTFFDPELQLINTKPMILNKLKELLNELKKFKVWQC